MLQHQGRWRPPLCTYYRVKWWWSVSISKSVTLSGSSEVVFDPVLQAGFCPARWAPRFLSQSWAGQRSPCSAAGRPLPARRPSLLLPSPRRANGDAGRPRHTLPPPDVGDLSDEEEEPVCGASVQALGNSGEGAGAGRASGGAMALDPWQLFPSMFHAHSHSCSPNES